MKSKTGSKSTLKGAAGKGNEGMRQTYKQTGKVEGLGAMNYGMGKSQKSHNPGGY